MSITTVSIQHFEEVTKKYYNEVIEIKNLEASSYH